MGAAVASRLGLDPSTRAPGPKTNRIGLAAVAALLVLFFSLRHEAFFSSDNATAIAVNVSSVAIAGMGTAILLITGYVDLSIGSMYALIGMIVAEVATHVATPAVPVGVGLLAGLVLGSINGGLVLALRISPLIVTIGLLAVYSGLAFVVSPNFVFGFSDEFIEIGRGELGSVPYSAVIALGVFALVSFILTRTVLGLRMYAAGGDPRAAERAGVRVGRLVFAAYAFNGMLIGLIAVLTTAKLGSGAPTLGANFEFDVLTAVILGGVAFSGGAGRPLGVLIGVITIGILDAGLIFEGLQNWWQEIAKGGIFLLALCADQIAAARRQRQVSRGAPAAEVSGPDDDVTTTFGADPQMRNGDAPIGGVMLDVRGVGKRYGAIRALDATSITLHAGEVVGLIGDNGAGKSTLVKIISGSLHSDGGELHLDGRRVAFKDPADARDAGIETVYQDLALCPNLSVVHNLMLGSEPTRRWLRVIRVRDDRRAADDAARRLGALSIRLADASVLVDSLSGGQRQAIAIARALDDHVRVVCLDEPTAALGVAQTASVLRLVDSVARSGTSVLMITHDVSSVMKVCDRVVVLRRGRMVHEGPTSELTELELLQLMAGVEAAPLPERH